MTSPSFSRTDAGFGDATLGEIGIPDSAPLFPELLDLDFAECDWMLGDNALGQQSEEHQQQGYARPNDVPVDMYPPQGMFGQEQSLDGSYWLPEVPDYNSLYNYQDPQPWIEPCIGTQPLVATPGLIALPGASDFAQRQPVEYQVLPNYPDPTTLMQPALPYYAQPVHVGHIGFTPIESGLQLTHNGLYDFGLQQMPYDFTDPSFSSGRSSSSNDEIHYSESESSDEYDDHSTTSSGSEYSRSTSIVSDTSMLKQPVQGQPEYRKGETPKKDDSKPWIRINGTTRGESTRTSKVNNWENKYKYRPLPVGNWQTNKYKFEYKRDNGVDFLKKIPMSTHQVKDYIREYPEGGDKHLIIWVQKTPADSGRRAGSSQHFKCLFRECPVQQWGDGTIMTGEFRVAFDEKHQRYRNEVDPFDCAAYAHLYCMERFLNFEKICRVADVRVDVRSSMPKEPKGKATFSFSGHPALPLLERFVKLASRNMLRKSSNFARYPVHDDYRRGERKPHENLLVRQIYQTVLKHLPDSQREQFARRAISTGQREIHLGDLEISMAVKKIQSMVGRKKWEAKGFQFERYYDECDPTINVRIAQRMAECAEIIKEADKRGSTKGKKHKKRKVIELSDDEDEAPQQRSYAFRPARSSPRKKQRTDYTEPSDIPQPGFITPKYGGLFSQSGIYAQHNQTPLRVLETTDPRFGKSPITPRSSCSDLFPRDGTLDIADFPLTQDEIPEGDFEKLMAFNNSLERRTSVSLGPCSGVMKSPVLRRTTRPTRQACFNAQPVSSRTEYFLNDPPSRVAASPRITFDQDELFERRSARTAARTVPNDMLSSDRASKHD